MILPMFWPHHNLTAVYQRTGGSTYVYLLNNATQLEAWNAMYQNHGTGAIISVMPVDNDVFEEMEPVFRAANRLIEGD